MAKIKGGFIKEVKEQQRIEEEQKRLKEKYHIEEENIKVVEKTNTFKFTMRILIGFLRLAVNFVLYLLALIGAISLIYPESREILIVIMNDILQQFFSFL